MNSARLFLVAVLVLNSQLVSAQDLSRYRVYALHSSLDSVVAASGLRAADTRTLHERPGMIQELEWRAPYARSGNELVDPVRGIIFSFCDDALYQVLVSYDRDRTDGLSNSDIVDSLTAAYGTPVLSSARNRPLERLPTPWCSHSGIRRLVADAAPRSVFGRVPADSDCKSVEHAGAGCGT